MWPYLQIKKLQFERLTLELVLYLWFYDWVVLYQGVISRSSCTYYVVKECLCSSTNRHFLCPFSFWKVGPEAWLPSPPDLGHVVTLFVSREWRCSGCGWPIDCFPGHAIHLCSEHDQIGNGCNWRLICGTWLKVEISYWVFPFYIDYKEEAVDFIMWVCVSI